MVYEIVLPTLIECVFDTHTQIEQTQRWGLR